MFAEVKAMMQNYISGDDYDEQIILEIKACAVDLTSSAEIILPGIVDITRTHNAATTSEPESWTITDNSTITDPLVFKVFATWCALNIGNPPNADRLQKAYDSLKGQMRQNNLYTHFRTTEEAEG